MSDIAARSGSSPPASSSSSSRVNFLYCSCSLSAMRPPSAAAVANVARAVDVVVPVLPDRAGLATHSRLSGTGLAVVDDHRPIEPRRQVDARLSGWSVADKPFDSAPEHLERPIRLRPPIHASTVGRARAHTRLPRSG